MKKCIKCLVEKETTEFLKSRNVCKKCISIYKKEYSSKNCEKIKNYMKEYYNTNQDLLKDRQVSRYRKDTKAKIEYQKKYTEINRERIRSYKKEYYDENKDSIREYKREYQNLRRKNDTIFKLKYIVSRMIRRSLNIRRIPKKSKAADILGCDILSFRSHLENLFTEEMTWENYGKVWDIDHRIPLSTAKSEAEVIKLNHYTNLQPLNSFINRVIKKDKIDFDQQNLPNKS